MNNCVLKFCIATLFCLLGYNAFSQENIDVEAKQILDNVVSKLTSSQSLQMEFNLVLDFAERNPITQMGKYCSLGEKHFDIVMEDNRIFSDGSAVFVCDNVQKNIQVYDREDFDSQNESFLNPVELISSYQSGEYEFAITGKDVQDGRNLTLIEFKPMDRYSEYSKCRIGIDENNQLPYYIKVFSKDGNQFTLVLNTINYNLGFEKNIFEFDGVKYTGFSIDDLRID